MERAVSGGSRARLPLTTQVNFHLWALCRARRWFMRPGAGSWSQAGSWTGVVWGVRAWQPLCLSLEAVSEEAAIELTPLHQQPLLVPCVRGSGHNPARPCLLFSGTAP